MTILTRWTIDLLEQIPHVAGERCEIIDGELYVTSQPHIRHQITAKCICTELDVWDEQTGLGIAIPAPDIIYAPDEAVAPDAVWVSRERFGRIVGESGTLIDAPELVVEILSSGKGNEERDREKSSISTRVAMFSSTGSSIGVTS
jgi:Uma2 family endonuclease